VILAVFLAFIFDFINGFHDAGNAIATIVTTNVLTPRQAVLWAAFFNFSAFLVFNLSVASTIGQGLIASQFMEPHIILSALVAAIAWNLLTWYLGLPSSSSHALIGGMAGAAVTKGGWVVLIPSGFVKVMIGILVAPFVGIIMGMIIMAGLTRLFEGKSDRKAKKMYKRFQLVSSACLSLTHGGNDAQKTMGVIAILLFSSGAISGPFHIPFWIVLSCQTVISLGTLIGGWRIVHTMGSKITTLNPMRGCAAETGAAMLLFLATETGIPMSTTQTVTGAIAGVGLLKGMKGINRIVLLRIFTSWMLTMPAVGLMAAGLMKWLSF
jgi:inorganic phosphate transporter, PiT family